MPSPERIEQLHEQLVPLGDEPAVAAERGEMIEPPRRPADNLDDDLSALLDDAEADSEALSASTEDDTAALLSDLDSVFDDDEPTDDEPAVDEDDPFAGLDLGGDDIDIPDIPDIPEELDELPDEDATMGDDAFPGEETPEAPGEPEELGDEDAELPDAPDVTDDTDDILAGFGDDTPDDTDDILAAFDDDTAADPFADLAELGEENLDVDESASDAESPEEEGFGDLDDLGGLDDLDDAEDPGDADDLGDAEDLGDLDDLGGLDDLDDAEDLGDADDLGAEDELGDLDDLGDLGDADDLGAEDELGDLDDFSLDDFGDTDEAIDEATDEDIEEPIDIDTGEDLDGELDEPFGADFDTDFDADFGADTDDDFAADLDSEADALADAEEDAEALAEADFAAATEELETGDAGEDDFGNDFGDQVAADFGDIDLDGDALSDDPLADLDDDAFELPAVDDELDSLDEEGFSLGDFGEEFDINEESIDEFAGLEVDTGGLEDETAEEAAAAPEESGPPPERELSDDEFRHLRATLGTLPLNVKIAAEEAVAEGRGSAEDQNTLIDLLIAGAPPTKVAEQVSRLVGKKIEVPKGYQKRSGVEFEEEKQSLAYQFRHVVLPFLRIAMAVAVATAIVGFLGYRFVYRPIHAAILYRQGYEMAEADQYQQANDTFDRAYDLRRRDQWFVEYAELYVDKYQYELAVEKYDQLVFGMDEEVRNARIQEVREDRMDISYPANRRGDDFVTLYELLNVDKPAILDHAELQSETLANYSRADDLYSIILYGNEYDYEALLGRGENFMRWGDQNSEYYERARQTYARMLDRYGDTDEILMRFLRFFVRTDNERQVREIVNIFENTSPDAEVHPVIYAEAAGYLLDRGEIVGIRDMLFRAYEEDPLVPEIHYELARYNRQTDAFQEERQALDNAIRTFEDARPLSSRRLEKQIDTFILSGEYWYERDEILRAQEDLTTAIDTYERAKNDAFLAPSRRLGRGYARSGDIQYYHARRYDQALERYDAAATDGYEPDELNFKRGFIHYRNGNYERATELFYDIGATNEFDGPNNVIYARGNTLYQRGNYIAAEALYTELLDRLQTQRARINTLLVDEDTTHRSLIENLVRTHNNLGVTRYRVGEQRSGTSDENPRLADALASLQTSTELSSNYLRDFETGERALATDLAYLNIQEILYPEPGGFEPQIYEELPRDTTQELW